MKLTLPQQDVYFEQLLYPDEPIYNIGAKIEIKGNIDFKTLDKAYAKLIDQHDAYRSILVRDQEGVELEILSEHNGSLGFVDFSNEKDAEEKANVFMQKTFRKPFDITSEEVLHTFILIKVEDKLYYLFSVYHHIITDGWGTSLMFQRLVKNYNELIETGTVETQYPYSYKDFIADDEKYYNSDVFERDKKYWNDKFQHLPESLFEKLDETDHRNRSNRKELIIKRSVYNQLSDIAVKSKSSTFHVILGILYLYFGRKHQNKDFAIGLPVLNRSKSVFKKTVGLFMGVSALRMNLDFESTFEELVCNIKQQLRQDYRHQRFPLGKLIQELDLFKEKDRLFNITLSYEKQNYADHFKDSETKVIPLTHQSERVALAVYIREFDEFEDVKIDFDYHLNYFDENAIHQVVIHVEQLIKEICINPDKKLLEYPYITKTEQQQLLHDFNQTKFNYPNNKTLLSFFQDQVKKRPDHLAVKDRANAYTYKELDAISNRIANYVCQNVDTDNPSPVAVLMDRSADLIATLLGIFKSGSAYIPLDPSFPKERLGYIVAHSEVQCIIGTDELENSINTSAKFLDSKTIINSTIVDTLYKERVVQSSDTAYIIYTSGSTGKPKGVAIGHQSLLNFLLSIQEKPRINTEDVLFSVTTQSFDISILEFFTPLISGATVCIADKDTLIDPLAIIEQLQQVKPTIIQATPSFYQMLYNAGWAGDKNLRILCGGDLLSKSLAQNLINTCAEVWNMYGPTETTIWSSIKKIVTADDASNIGKPINNTKFYILDECLKLLPVGVPGNIYIGGDGLALGYFKNKALTAEKFIINPFDTTEKIYNTGDIGKWTIDGEIEFYGRNDNQVKIRGYRIELGEIETKLNQLITIKSSVVVAKKSKAQEATLIAYVILDQPTVNIEEVILSLRKVLPEYMIPYTMIPLDHFPLTPNKKVDRKLLTQREIGITTSKSTFVKPTTDLEIRISEYYREILGLANEVSATDNFFMLGGHSLNAVRLIGRIEKELHYQISLKTIFDHPTVTSLSGFLEEKEIQEFKRIVPVTGRSHYPITLHQYAIWLAGLQREKSIAYNMFTSYRVHGALDNEILGKAFLEVIDKYEVLRTNFIDVEGHPYQKINPKEHTSFTIDTFFLEDGDMQASLEDYANQEFDLENDVLLRVGSFRSTNGDKILLFVTHHIIMDGWSLEILIKEVILHYTAFYAKANLTKEVLDFQFKDYVVWQQEVESQNKKRNHQFWKRYLDGYQWQSLLPYDQESIDKKHLGTFYHFNWSTVFLKKLNDIALQQNITLHTLLATVFNVLIHKMNDLDDICLGTINSGRPFSHLHAQMGMFVKTLPLRLKIDPHQSFKKLLQTVQENLLIIDKYQDIPEDILSTLRLEAILVMQNQTFDYESIEIHEDLVLKSHYINPTYNRLPLLINFSVNENTMHGSIHYDTHKYEKESMEILVLKYEKILEQLFENADILLSDIDIDLAFEKEDTIDIDFSF